MPDANVRRWGMGSPEPHVNREGTQVNNLCYEEPHREGTQVNNLCYEGPADPARAMPGATANTLPTSRVKSVEMPDGVTVAQGILVPFV